MISKNIPKNIATAKGHLEQEANNLRSTSRNQDNRFDETIAPKQEIDNKCTQYIMCAIIDSKKLYSKSYFNQTGLSLIMSSRGNQHIFIMYHYDANNIYEVPIKNRQAASITKA